MIHKQRLLAYSLLVKSQDYMYLLIIFAQLILLLFVINLIELIYLIN